MKKILLKTSLFVLAFFMFSTIAHADDSGPHFSVGGASVKVGQTFEVPVSVSFDSAYTLEDFELHVTLCDKVEYVGAGGTSAKGSGVGNIRTLQLKANAPGDCTIGFDTTGSYVTIDGNKYEGADITKSAANHGAAATLNGSTISISELSSDSSLKSLKIPNGTIDPAFKSDVYNYKTTVTDVTAIDIDAKPNNAGAKVEITPNYKALVKGDNDVSIVVTSETGTQTTYTIKVTLKTTPTPEEIKLADATLKNLTVKGQKIDFNKDEKKYYLTVDYDTKKLIVNATPNNEKATVKIMGNDKLIVGKNTIKVIVTSEDKTKTETYQIIVTRNAEEKEIVETCPDTTSTTEWIIFTVSMLLTFTLGIVLGYFLCKKEVLKKIFKKKKEEEPVAIETLSDTIDLTGAVKEAKKEVKKEK